MTVAVLAQDELLVRALALAVAGDVKMETFGKAGLAFKTADVMCFPMFPVAPKMRMLDDDVKEAIFSFFSGFN